MKGPSQSSYLLFLQEISSMASEPHVNDDLVKHKFIQAVLLTINPVIVAQKELNLKQLGTLADELLPFLQAKSHVASINSFQILQYSQPQRYSTRSTSFS